MSRHLYLRKANDELISHCRCSPNDALIGAPGQLDCPWCGCGWLFVCRSCRKAFTFAEAVEIEEPWEETATRCLRGFWGRDPEPGEVEQWIGCMQILLKDIRPGNRYVYFDGWIVPTKADGITVEGWHSRHDLAVVPQVEALRDRRIIPELLAAPGYWQSTALTAIKRED
jgi:hypothetical protein